MADDRTHSRARIRRRRAIAAGVVVLALIAIVAALTTRGHVARAGARHAPVAVAPPARPVHVRHAFTLTRAQEIALNERILAHTPYIALGHGRRREVALTFDDGPSPWTPKILAILRRDHAVATFFEIGREVSMYPQYTADLARAGMAIGDHTETHPPLADLPEAGQAEQIDDAARAIERAGAPRPLLFRPPYGSLNPTTLAVLRAQHMIMVLWSADTSDYAQPGVKRIQYTALSGAQTGEIVLMHDGGGPRSQTVAALPRIIDGLRARGYRLVTIWRLLHDDPPNPHQPQPRSLAGG